MPVSTVTAGAKYWVDLIGVTPGSYSFTVLKPVQVRVAKFQHVWPVPLYMEMQFAQIARAHNLADVGETLAQRMQLAKDYANRLRAHGVEPVKQHYSVYPPSIHGRVKEPYSTTGSSTSLLVWPIS